jgi:hypothetical protein
MVDMLLVLLTGSFVVQVGADSHGGCAAGAKEFAQDPGVSTSGDVSYASLFSVSYHSTYKVVKYDPVLSKYKSSWPEASQRDTDIPDLVLYQCGTTKPTLSHNGISEHARFYEIPLKSIALPWTGVLPFVEMLSATEAISLIDLTYITSPCAQLLEMCTPGIHSSIYGANWSSSSQNAEVVFTDSFGTGWSNSSRDVVFDVSLDAGILHRAEWLKFMAVFFNEEKAAADIFSRIEADYKALEKEGAELKAAHGGPKTVAWVTWAGCVDVACDGITPGEWVQKADGNWCKCGSFYSFSNTHFRRDATQGAGGRLLPMPSSSPAGCTFKTNSDGSQTYECDGTQLQHVLELLSSADVVFDETYVANHATYTLDDFASNFVLSNFSGKLSAMTNEAVYRIDAFISDAREDSGSVGNSWFEGMPSQPQQLLSDMMKALWGKAFKGKCEMKFFRHLHSAESQTINKHTDCPAHSPSGAHKCDEIHAMEKEVPQCATPPTTTTTTTTQAPTTQAPVTQAPSTSDAGSDDTVTSDSTASGGNRIALGLGLGLGLGLPVLHCMLPMSL